LREIIGEVKNPKNNENYEIAIEAGRCKSEAYKANIRRRIRRLTCYGRYKSSESGSDGVGGRSNIKSRSKVVARL
jgi:hypothetical protein